MKSSDVTEQETETVETTESVTTDIPDIKLEDIIEANSHDKIFSNHSNWLNKVKISEADSGKHETIDSVQDDNSGTLTVITYIPTELCPPVHLLLLPLKQAPFRKQIKEDRAGVLKKLIRPANAKTV